MRITDSQNFLHNKELVEELVNNSNINSNDNVLEIGPGKGIITLALLKKCKYLKAVELDEALYKDLKLKLKDNKNFDIILNDILEMDDIYNENYKIFSNIPFNITSSILSKFLSDEKLTDLYLIMQYEAYKRFSSNSEEYLTYKYLLYKPFYEFEIVHKFSPLDFKPEPNARIILSHIYKKNKPDLFLSDLQLYLDFITYIFEKKSKQAKEKIEKLFTINQLNKILTDLKINENTLFTELTYNQVLSIFKVYAKYALDVKKKIVKGFYKQKEDVNKKTSPVTKNWSSKNNW